MEERVEGGGRMEESVEGGGREFKGEGKGNVHVTLPYYRLTRNNGRRHCRTVPTSHLIHVSTAVLRYGPKP